MSDEDAGGTEARISAAIATTVFALLGLYLVVAVVQRVALFADGSYWFLGVLMEPSLPSWNPRWASYSILSAPLVLAVRSGVRDIATLELFFGVGMYAHFAVMVLICARAAERRRHLLVFPAASFFLVSANMGFWPHTGSHVMVSLFWSLLFLLVLPTTRTAVWLVMTIGIALLATSAFESMLLLGPLLSAVAIWRFRHESDRVRRIGAAVVAVLCLIGSAVAILGIRAKAPGHFTKSALALVNSHGYFHALLVLSLAAFALVISANSRHDLVWRLGAGMLTLACIGWLAACLIAPQSTLSVSLHHDVRTFNLWFTLALAAAFLWWALPSALPPARIVGAWRIVALLAVAQTAWMLIATVHWQHYRTLIRQDVATHVGIRPFEATALNQDEDRGRVLRLFTWGWTLPLLSVLEAPGGDVRSIIANPTWYSGWTPFEITDPSELARLERYGIRFTTYRTAISGAP